MDYLTASLKLTGRCKDQRKLCNNTYLIRRSDEEIAVRLHATDVVTFHADGSIDIGTGGWNTVTTKDRINAYCAIRVWSESGYMFARYGNQCVGFDCTAYLGTDGKLIGDCTENHQRAKIREERNERNRPRNRARYWITRARERKPFRGSIENILQEENSTVRVAKMQCYGIEKFFLDAKPKTIDTHGDYLLLEIPGRTWTQNVRALKMTCPSTSAVYINMVPPQTDTVARALDFMFNTTDYLGTISQQS